MTCSAADRLGVLAWIERAADWEQHRRRGLDFPLQASEAAIPPEEDAVSIDAAMAMRATLAQDTRAEACAVLALFDALVGRLTGHGASAIAGGVLTTVQSGCTTSGSW